MGDTQPKKVPGEARTKRGAREVCSPKRLLDGTERIRVQTREWVLTVAVILVPLIIAAAVTIWSLDQVRYRPKKRRPAPAARETGAPVDGRMNAEGGRSGSGDG